ncbi:Putative methyltransferase PMT27 [Glycine soja]|nr:Putative methyltransferase PMT27 [Glycine soja]
MAQATKSRNSRRPSSSSSYTSTLTTLIFIALCVLGLWMLTSNTVVTPKTRTAIDDNISETTNTDLTQDTTATTTTTNNIPDDFAESITTISQDLPRETATNIPHEIHTKIQDQKDATVFGDNPGNLPDDAIKNDLKKETSIIANEATGSDSDQKANESEKESQNNIIIAQDEKENLNSKQNTEPEIANVSENIQEEGTGGGGKSNNNDDDANVQQLREDKGEAVAEREQKEKEENEKRKKNNRKKSNKGLKKEGSSTESNDDESTQRGEKKGSSTESNDDESTQQGEKKGSSSQNDEESSSSEVVQLQDNLKWSLCNVTAGMDYIPCLDNDKYLKTSRRKHYEHRERHCPEDAPTCLVPLPKGYKTPIQWPSSRDKIWYHNIPHTLLADVKGHQNWVKLTGEFLTFPGGGTQFIHGALHYIDFLQQAEPGIAWGKHTRVILDVGCGVGSLGGYLFERDVIAMSFAPKDEHEAQVQFALERGIPAISAVMGTQRLQFPSEVFDLIHCARCRVPWHEDGGLLLLELNRLLRPGGYFVWCATPVYQTIEEDAEIWKQMKALTKSMCWELVTIKKDALNQVGAAFYRKPTSNECYEQREQNQPPMCKTDDDPNAAWYVPLQACMHKLPTDKDERGTRWPEPWPRRLEKAPYWLNNLQGGKQASHDFATDNERWKNVVDELSNVGVSWSNVRNIMDMRATYGGFAAALKDLPVWVFNVVNTDAPDTLAVIYERGLIGIYHDWCESFSTYPRTYDLLHADHLFSILKNRCNLVPVVTEIDRIVRPGGNLIVRDESSVIGEVEALLKSLHWEITSTNLEGLLCGKKGMWRPSS